MKRVLGLCVLTGLALSTYGTTFANHRSAASSNTSRNVIQVAREKQPGDDHGKKKGERQPGDDKGHKRVYYAREKQPGDDRGKKPGELQLGDDKGHKRSY